MKEDNINKVIKQFIKSANAFDVTATLALFAHNAVIDDVSVGEKFKHAAGIKNYLEKFFVGYNTVTKLESVEVLDNQNANAEVDFTGDFGHETGVLNFTLDSTGLIKTIHAHLN
jgi:ketosteroid isomerase-like protein